MSSASAERPGETDFHIVTLDQPEALAPQRHAFSSESLHWLALSDDLPHG